jgi:ribonucleoside-diphosphate reductase alpha chain
MMDCESTGIEPVFAESAMKTLANGETVEIKPECVEIWLDNYDGIPQTAIGENPVSVDGHLLMMAAMQPHLSGAISKTVNLPASATVEDVKEVYRRAWELGLKCIALFRDGCKGYQPLETTKKDYNKIHERAVDHASLATKGVTVENVQGYNKLDISRTPGDMFPVSVTHKFAVNGMEGYITAGLYEDGTPGEVFVHIDKVGSTVGGMVDAWAALFSIALQYRVPLEKLVGKFKGSRFEPSGFTGNPAIPSATSIVDYVAKWLDVRFLGNDAVDLQSTDQDDEGVNIRGHQTGDACPECGPLLYQTGTCKSCPSCGYTGGCG